MKSTSLSRRLTPSDGTDTGIPSHTCFRGAKMKRIAILAAGMFLCAIAFAQNTLFSFEFEEIAEDVWVGVRPDGPRFPVMGNTMFVIGDEGVVVFDGGGAATMADQIIEKIRSLTTNPVTHVVISHWHGDHNFGVYRFAEEFPDVQFVAHRFTAKVIDSTRIAYIDRNATMIERNLPEFRRIAETGIDSEGNEVSAHDRESYARTLEDADLIEYEFQRLQVIAPNVIFDDKLTIESGKRRLELLHLGHANTAGDIVMWLPDEQIVATGDIVVLPTPYAFNVPPRAWAETLRNINALDYKTLVPGHGEVQRDTDYVDLIIESADSIADQRDALLADGLAVEEVGAALDFSAFEKRFTGEDDYVKVFYDAYFEQPFREAAMKALTGEPMVAIEEAEVVSLDDERWSIEAQESERVNYLGQDALRLLGGTAVLGETEILNGIVEFDIAVTPARGFAGLMFRVEDTNNYEHFYIRPHQSGKPDANQYTPVFNGVSAWQLYHGSDYAVPTTYRYDDWMHVKIVYAGTRADIYIDSDRPVLRVNDLKRGVAGGNIGIDAANFASAYFANVSVSKLADAYVLPASPAVVATVPARRIKSWSVSEPFAHTVLEGMTNLEPEVWDAQEWTTVEAEATGITNLAAVPMQSVGENTRFARLRVKSDGRQSKQLTIGYSDKAKVFVNSELQYSGDNTYQSRDYRYLGTIGLFETVVLPLEVGENEILIAVTEAFGGWGVMAELENLDGVEIMRVD
jgi:glyoxylase-like metal-dependent hydrolase (beta-lactamase superfamily II)